MITKTFEELKLSQKLPSPSGVGMRILELTRSDDFSAEEIGDTIKTDSSLTGRILKLANSASNAGVEPATTVSHSIMRLGSRTVRDLALAFSLVSGHRGGVCAGFDYQRYWSLSLARAVAAQAIARISGGAKPEEAYICALLADIGQLALASVHPEAYTEVFALVTRVEFDRLRELESERFDIDHGQVAVCMMTEWGLPEIFSEAIQAFTKSRSIEPGSTDGSALARILRMAEVVAEFVNMDAATSLTELESLGRSLETVRRELDIESGGLSAFVDGIVREWGAWGESLAIETLQDVSYLHLSRRVEDAQQRLSSGEVDPPRPRYVVEGSAVVAPAPVSTDVESSSDLGLPDGEAEEGDFRGSTAESPEERPIRILAIDDDPVTLKILVTHLKKGGYEVMEARDGKDGLRLALECDPEIIMSDWVMPGLDGLELCRELRRTDSGRSMYYLLLTGRSEEERVVEAFEAGVDDYITKPFIPRILSARIKGATRLVNLQRIVEAERQTVRQQVAEMGQLTRKLRSAALTDALTGLPNRRYAMKRMENEWSFMRRTGRPLTLIMMDIDHFKSVNDTYGHDIGDIVLQETARQLTASVRDSDEVCRIGGEEFLVICKNTLQTDGMIVAERIRAAVEAHVIEHPAFAKSVTLSLGVAGCDEANGTVSQLLKRADEAVYAAKNSGRNRACQAESTQYRKSA